MTPLEIETNKLLVKLHSWVGKRLVADKILAPRRKLPMPRLCIMEAKRSKKIEGWYSANRWERGAAKLHEIVLTPAVVAAGPIRTAEVIMHELVHLANHTAGHDDTSRQGRFHNKKFKLTAECVGLIVTKDPREVFGWNQTDLGTELKSYIEFLIKSLKIDSKVFQYKRLPKPRAEPSLVKLASSCNRFVYTTPSQAIDMVLLCGHCGAQFKKES